MGSDETRPEVERLRSNAPGSDPESPYADVDLGALPAWWRRAVREFDDHGLRPYRPPRFADGTPTHEVVPEVEAELDAAITFRNVDGDPRGEWGVYVDGERVLEIGRHRSQSGYTVYEMDADEFETMVRNAAGTDHTPSNA